MLGRPTLAAMKRIPETKERTSVRGRLHRRSARRACRESKRKSRTSPRFGSQIETPKGSLQASQCAHADTCR